MHCGDRIWEKTDTSFKMNALLLISLLFGVAYGSDVIDFTDNDFKDNIGDHALILVEFFAPW